MSAPSIQGVHLVGSIPLDNEETVFRTVCKALPGRLKRIPDGETGTRYYWVRWQLDLFKHEPRLVNEAFNIEGSGEYTDDQAEEVIAAMKDFETHYDDYALKSYDTFKRLKDEGVIPRNVRFQVSLPTPLAVVALHTRTSLRSRLEPIYQDAMLRSIKRIQENIPASELAIQWDTCMEIAMLEDVAFAGNVRPWFQPVLEGIVDRLEHLVESVAHGVEVGFHLCYGDSEHKHFKEPKDTSTLVELSNAILAKTKREINFIHMPVPKDRTDSEYFKPLTKLVPDLGVTELVLGLVHYDDLEGTKKRISTAGEFVESFGIATECGMGRTPKEQLDDILSISAAVSSA